MTPATYGRINTITRAITTWLPICTVWVGIFLFKSVWLVLLAGVVSVLPYLIGYNIVVRGWLFRKVESERGE